MKIDELSDQVAAVVDDDIELLYLFGSRVAAFEDPSAVGPLSDYDFGVVVEREADRRAIAAALAHALVKLLGTDRIDVIVLNDAPIELAYAVIAKGRLLYQRDTATRVAYETKVLGLYGDYLPVLKAHRRDILEGDDYDKRVRRYRAALRRTEHTLSEIAPAPEPES